MKTILYLTDLYYNANSRLYYEEDLFITSRLLPHFNILLGHPRQALNNLHRADLVVFRNTGPVIHYKDYFQKFKEAVIQKQLPIFNSFDGKADMQGKVYLLHLSMAGYPVIPTVDTLAHLSHLGSPAAYVTKLKDGADSIGLEIVNSAAMAAAAVEGKLIQPFLDFEYEVSFYYLNDKFQYALFAPDKQKRWDLQPYETSETDRQFADLFIRWNNMAHGIQRVDACRLKDGSLLLVELEDLNPFLSITLLAEKEQAAFLANFIAALERL